MQKEKLEISQYYGKYFAYVDLLQFLCSKIGLFKLKYCGEFITYQLIVGYRSEVFYSASGKTEYFCCDLF